MKHLRFTLFATFLLLLINACGQSSKQPAYTLSEAMCEEEMEVSSSGDVPPPPPAAPSQPTNRKLVTKGEVTLEVKQADVDSISKNLNKLIAKYNGYKTEDKQSPWYYSSTAKIPAASFDAFVESLNTIGGKMTNKSISVKDMTDYYSDLESSTKSKEAALEQYRVLLKRANKISEIIEIQSRIDDIQEDLDRNAKNRINIDKQVAYSELDIELRISDYTDNRFAPTKEPSFGSRLADALSGSLDLIENIIVAIFYIWPLLLIIGVIVFFIIRKRKKNKK